MSAHLDLFMAAIYCQKYEKKLYQNTFAMMYIMCLAIILYSSFISVLYGELHQHSCNTEIVNCAHFLRKK